MLLFIVKTPKRHFLCRKHAVWALTRRRTTRGATGTLSEVYKKKIKKGSPESKAKIWVVAQTPPVNRSLPNFACGFVSRMCFLLLSFRKIGWKMWELWGVEISPLPLTRHIAYTTACCHRSSSDVKKNFIFIISRRRDGSIETLLYCVVSGVNSDPTK